MPVALGFDEEAVFNYSPLAISVKLGFPLVIEALQVKVGKNNRYGTWLMINPRTGFAPVGLCQRVGDVLVARADKEPLTVPKLRSIMDYIHEIILAAEDGPKVVGEFYDRARLDKYIADHIEMQKDPQGACQVNPFRLL